MTNMLNFAKKLWSDDEGATAIEYGLLAALIAVVIIGAVIDARRRRSTSVFTDVNTDLTDAPTAERRRAGRRTDRPAPAKGPCPCVCFS